MPYKPENKTSIVIQVRVDNKLLLYLELYTQKITILIRQVSLNGSKTRISLQDSINRRPLRRNGMQSGFPSYIVIPGLNLTVTYEFSFSFNRYLLAKFNIESLNFDLLGSKYLQHIATKFKRL